MKIENLQTELEHIRSESQKILNSEAEKSTQEISKITSEFSSKERADKEEIARLSNEISLAHNKYNEVLKNLSLLEIESKRATDQAVALAVQSEQSKCEQIIEDLKNRLDMFMRSRKVLEARCEQYINEINTIREENSIFVLDLTTQNKNFQDEILNLRERNLFQKSQLNDYNEAIKLRKELETKVESLTSSLNEANTERSAYISKINDMENKIQNLLNHRNNDFNNFSLRINEALRSELLNIRSSLS